MTDDLAVAEAAADQQAAGDVVALAGAVAAAGLPGTVLRLDVRHLVDDEWHALLRYVRSQHLTGLLLTATHDGSSSPLEQSRRDPLIKAHRHSMESVLFLERSMLQTVQHLEDAGVESRVLKGSAVARLDYTNPSLRPFGDVDLMVRPSDFETALTTLRERGFRRAASRISSRFDRQFGKGATLLGPDGVYVDLHRTFVQGRFGLTVDLGDAWDDPQPFVVAGSTLYALSPEARLLHACYHAVLGGWPARLLPYRDVAEMALYGTWDDVRLRTLSRRWKADSVLATAVREAWELLGLEDSTALSTWAQEFQVPVKDDRVMALHRTRDSSYAARQLAALPALPWRHRVAYAMSLAVPSREFLDSRGMSLPEHLGRAVRRAISRTTPPA